MALTAVCAWYEANRWKNMNIQTIRKAHAALAGGSETDELFKIIHQPGWATPAELAFLITALESIKAQAAQRAAMQQSLVAAAQLVSTARAAGA
jgi:hypothetical protein